MKLSRFLVGDTIRVTWINSNVIPSVLFASVYDGNEILVDSGTMTSSGNGYYFYDHTIVNTPGFYVVETRATIASMLYKRRVKFQASLIQVD